jgi:hypothetical protein
MLFIILKQSRMPLRAFLDLSPIQTTGVDFLSGE